MNKIIKMLLILISAGIVITGIIYRQQKETTQQPKQEKENTPITNTKQTQEQKIEDVIEKYLIGNFQDSNYKQNGKFFCQAKVKWMHDLGNNEKTIYAPNRCEYIIPHQGDLRGSSGGEESGFFKVKQIQGSRQVIDADNRRISPAQPITQDWIKQTINLIPQDIIRSCPKNKCFSTEGIIDDAAKYFNIDIPQYSLTVCKDDNDCSGDELCYQQGDRNPGPSVCVKKCTGHKDCGVAHTCRQQCVQGENGCPYTSKAVCIPDLLHIELLKKPNDII